MPQELAEILRLELPCDQRAPQVVREALDDVAELDLVREDATLVASELVTNAVLHSDCGQDDVIEVCARRSEDRLLILVHDPGTTGSAPEAKRDVYPGRGGLGLRIVQELAHRWGAERPDGRLVWAELAI